MLDHWAKAFYAREQIVLFPRSLDLMIPEDHQVRLLAEVLDLYDWSAWEAHYHGRIGQPPIHPKVLAGLLLYGMRHGVRSSRRLEYMAGHAIDFIWLLEGRKPDHSTICEFRTKFGAELKDLFRNVVKMALEGGFLQLAEMFFDGTRVKASNNRFETWTNDRIDKAIAALGKEFDEALEEFANNDQSPREGEPSADVTLPPHLADLKERQEFLKEIQQKIQEADALRRKEGIDPKKNPAQIPKHDPDARVMPNKEGGYAVNYNPVAAAEGHGGYILHADVLNTINEQDALLPAIIAVAETLGQPPAAVGADTAFSTGDNIAQLEALGIEFLSPLPEAATRGPNPALRSDPTQPVPESEWDNLPVNPQHKMLDKACFVYDAERDVYYCPQGRELPFEQTKIDTAHGKKIQLDLYRSVSCEGCPLQGRCIHPRNSSGARTISRDVHTETRERHAAKMNQPEAREKYARRMHGAETPFAYIKQVLGLRQFLLRGLEKVKLEWLWACLASNVWKLVRDIRNRRAQQSAEPAKIGVN